MNELYKAEKFEDKETLKPIDRFIDALIKKKYQDARKQDLILFPLKKYSKYYSDGYDRSLFLKMMFLSIFFTGFISICFYYLVAVNYINLHIYILQLMTIFPLIRTDFFSYVTILIPVTAFFNYHILLKKHVKFGYALISIPLMFIVMPGILDNFYIYLFNIEVQNRMEIQFIFLDNLNIRQYQFLSIGYTIAGFVFLRYVKKYWHFFAISCFAILMYSSLIIRLGIQTYAYNVSSLNYFPMWLGIDIVDVSFMKNVPIYLGINFSIIAIVIFLGIYLKNFKDKLWNFRF
ncbi:MAG: hypothetical protein ACTSRG_02455 [Candidatus Helarchaeota archaeon]